MLEVSDEIFVELEVEERKVDIRTVDERSRGRGKAINQSVSQ